MFFPPLGILKLVYKNQAGQGYPHQISKENEMSGKFFIHYSCTASTLIIAKNRAILNYEKKMTTSPDSFTRVL